MPYDLNGCLEAFGEIELTLCREYGLCNLPTTPTGPTTTPDVRVIDFLLHEEDQPKVLDVVEVSFRLLNRLRSSPEWLSRIPQEKFDKAVTKLNARLRECGIGYQYENGEMVRIESQFLHAEVVKPALALLSAKETCHPENPCKKRKPVFPKPERHQLWPGSLPRLRMEP